MTWRAAANRARKARKELPAVARPSEGPAQLQLGVSSLNCAADVSTTGAPAALFVPRKLKNGEYPPRAEFRQHFEVGLSDRELGRRYNRSEAWAETVRMMYRLLRTATPVRVEPPAPSPAPTPPAPQLTRGERHAAHYTEFFAANGPYPSYGDGQIKRFEQRWAIAHPARPPSIADLAPTIYGDPAPDRPRA